jgi:hypothetical protein
MADVIHAVLAPVRRWVVGVFDALCAPAGAAAPDRKSE